MRRKFASTVLATVVATGIAVGVAATPAAAAAHWSGNYSTKASCNLARLAHEDYGQPTTPCYSSYDRNGNLSYHFYWYY